MLKKEAQMFGLPFKILDLLNILGLNLSVLLNSSLPFEDWKCV